jgi:hypothetical protein
MKVLGGRGELLGGEGASECQVGSRMWKHIISIEKVLSDNGHQEIEYEKSNVPLFSCSS